MRSGFKLGTFFSLVITAAMASCGSDETAPATCGNGAAEADEQCDGADLRGQVCSGVIPNSSGLLKCLPTCTWDTALCSGGGGQGGQGGAGPNP